MAELMPFANPVPPVATRLGAARIQKLPTVWFALSCGYCQHSVHNGKEGAVRVTKTYHERVALTRKDGDLIDRQGLCVLAVGLDDSHRVTIDLERVVRVA